MSRITTRYLQCDICSDLTTDSTSSTAFTTFEMIEVMMKKSGWIKVKNKHACADCIIEKGIEKVKDILTEQK
jgi:hypothetical protein